MRILAFGTYDVVAHPRVGVLLQGLRDRGHEVVELNHPLGFDTAARIRLVRQPWRVPLFGLRLLRIWARLARGGLRARRRFRPDAVLVGYLGHFDVHLARLLFGRSGTPIVLDHLVSAAGTAADRALTGDRGPRTRMLRWIDTAALDAADVVLVDTDQRRTAMAPAVRERTVVCPVGATDAWFAAGDQARRRSSRLPLQVVFVGLYTPLHGTPVIAQAVARLADDERIAVTMIGSGQDRAAAQRAAGANPRITWLDWVPGAELPELVARHDVSLGIFGTTAKAQEVVPTKAYQGAAAATVVLTSDTAPQRAALTDAAVLVPAGDPEALAEALRRLADDPHEVDRLRRSAYDRALDRFTAAAAVDPVLQTLTASGTAVRSSRLESTPSVSDPAHLVPPGEPVTDTQPRTPGSATARTNAGKLPPLAIRAILRYDVVRRQLDRLRPATALEIGCGQGSFGARLAERADYVGVEPDDSSYEVARERITVRGGSVLHGIHTVVPAGSTYDLVCAFEVLEHIEDDVAALADWVEFIRPGGHLLLSVPAFQDRFGPMDVHAGHFRRYSPELLRSRLTDAGLTDVDITVYGWPLGYALEAVRNRVDARKLKSRGDASMAELTQASGRTVQPTSALVGTLVAAATTPFARLQRLRSRAGTGLVAVARRPLPRTS